MPYTTLDLIKSIERRAVSPTNQLTFQSDEWLVVADEETRGIIVPSITRLREDYFTTYSDISLVRDQAAYAIPARSAGMVVRDLAIVDESNSVKRLRHTEIERVKSYSSGSPDAFHFRGNKIVLVPTPSTSAGVLRVYYSLSPAKLVVTSEAAVISSIDTDLSAVTVTSIPSTWATGNRFDLTKQDGGQEPLAIDLLSSDISNNVITLPSLPDDLRVGDYVTLAGETALVQMPAEYRDVLAQAVAARVLADMDQAGADRAMKKLETLLQNAERQFKPRSIGEPQVILTSHWD